MVPSCRSKCQGISISAPFLAGFRRLGLALGPAPFWAGILPQLPQSRPPAEAEPAVHRPYDVMCSRSWQADLALQSASSSASSSKKADKQFYSFCFHFNVMCWLPTRMGRDRMQVRYMAAAQSSLTCTSTPAGSSRAISLSIVSGLNSLMSMRR